MRVRVKPLTLVVALAAALLVGCGRPSVGLRIAGSTSLQPLAEMLAEGYRAAGGARVSTQGVGSTAGLQALRSGVADLATVSRRLTPEEMREGFQAHVIAWDVLAIAVHPSNSVDGLTLAELRRLFAGEIRDWAQLGGTAGRVHLISREAGSGSRQAFRELVGPIHPLAAVQNTNGAIRLAVRNDPAAVGYLSLGVARAGGVKLLRIDGYLPGEPGYPLVRPLSLVTLGPPAGEARAFLAYALSPAGQKLVADEGMLPVR
ncbi:phosphate ABC transporter substrate-binding protein [Symbiobacterium thermophilum]|uniref:Phosphate ABC transporter phosphate-binding protein n=2 Tax=Symbiobacterium thermophilum TaxID=2734 RepID=Q67SX3_SYMTH|nr:phosphate ABC transporter substrate-binding protein [Symbiobacterium thermophilum]MBY6275211.1 phosphate-binding protein [Symbiobacterium thermophilum]BAD39220.1 phosphate ABC transporter phosphate-binding protein [Symbiobacterium thermophilum IAM 14863]